MKGEEKLEKELVQFYLNRISMKLQWTLNNNEAIRNDLLMYLEICIDICNLLEKRYYKTVGKERNIFQLIQASILEKDYLNALEFTKLKIKELDKHKALI